MVLWLCGSEKMKEGYVSVFFFFINWLTWSLFVSSAAEVAGGGI